MIFAAVIALKAYSIGPDQSAQRFKAGCEGRWKGEAYSDSGKLVRSKCNEWLLSYQLDRAFLDLRRS
jgi:hypothetical protein